MVADLSERWSVSIGRPFQPGGHTAWVAPAGDDVVVKIGWRHPEAEHEAEGLRVWNGAGAARLHAVAEFPDTIALLLERCVPGHPLRERPEDEQDGVVAALLRRLWREPEHGHPFRTLQSMCDQWADRFEARPPGTEGALDAGLVREGVRLFRSLPRSADRSVLLCTDLHAGNILAATREPWLAIDPKPYVGDPTYDVLQHFLNCDRLLRDPRRLVGRMADLLGLDAERLGLWLFARAVIESGSWPGMADVARRMAP